MHRTGHKELVRYFPGVSDDPQSELRRFHERPASIDRFLRNPEEIDKKLFTKLAHFFADLRHMKDFEAEVLKNPEMRRFKNGNILSHYKGYLLESYLRFCLAVFIEENPDVIAFTQFRGGTTKRGNTYNSSDQGNIYFKNPKAGKPGERMVLLGEIDSLCEFFETAGRLTPIIFEATWTKGENINGSRKMELVEELYGSHPQICVVRPTYSRQEAGAYIEVTGEKEGWRVLRIPGAQELRSLAESLCNIQNENR